MISAHLTRGKYEQMRKKLHWSYHGLKFGAFGRRLYGLTFGIRGSTRAFLL
jgi:hypothetical protein